MQKDTRIRMMYSTALWLHSLVRWAVLLAGLVSWFRAIGGRTAKRPWTAKDDLWAMIFTMALDIEMLVGLVMYIFLSDITRMGITNLAAGMRIADVRFFTVEHVLGMIVAIALAHVGRAKLRKTPDAARRHRLVLIYFGIALVIIIASIPWPGMRVARPLLRF